MGVVSLGVGCLLGAGLLFGFPIWLGWFGHSLWWLLGSAFLLGMTGKSPSLKYNQMWAARQRGQSLSGFILIYLLPVVIAFGFQVALFLIARAIWPH